MARHLCIHGHFYQPPRENAWLERVQLQEGADPYHDWNARIDAECYAPNGAARILDGAGRIARIVNNYARISFDFGPTLLSWLEAEAPGTYESVLAADRESAERFSGHGSALAQGYNHAILPLANERDRRTQVRWGVRDFERRFGRAPQGMWLPEAAVDLASLDELAAHGIRFTILAPHQARRFRARGAADWTETSATAIDTSRAYEQRLPSGRSIALFFYDGATSRAIAFERLLDESGTFLARLRSRFAAHDGVPELVHVATDGETYGHHHRFGEMALAAALQALEADAEVRLTNYGEFLERHPPAYEVEIAERTSWSCEHGVERWRADCGCRTGTEPTGTQSWRAPLRAAFDALRDELAPRFERGASELLRDPWAARDEYVDVVLDRGDASRQRFFERHALRELGPAEEVRALKLLELQRHALLMYTSCGWFFDDVARIEAVQVIQYAARAVQLAEELFGERFEPRFLEDLSRAKSNLPERGDARRIFEAEVRPAMLDLRGVCAHHALSSLFEPPAEHGPLTCYELIDDARELVASASPRLVLGRCTLRSAVTRERASFAYAAAQLGGFRLSGGVSEARAGEAEAPRALFSELAQAAERGDAARLAQLIDGRFGASALSLRSLFPDARRALVETLLEARLDEADAAYLELYRRNEGLLQLLEVARVPLPRALAMAAERAVHHRLESLLCPAEPLELDEARHVLREARAHGIALDRKHLEYRVRTCIEALAAAAAAAPDDATPLRRIASAAELLAELPFAVDLWRVQNEIWRLLQARVADRRRLAAAGDADAGAWMSLARALGEKLALRVE